MGILGITFALGALAMFLYMDLGNKSTEVAVTAESSEEGDNPVTAVEPQREGFANSDTPPPERAKVVRVFDGLTIGLDSGHVVRYLGVRLPSVGQPVQCFGKEGVTANEGMIGKEVRLEADPLLEKAQDGAWVRYVWVAEADEIFETLPSVVTQGPDGEFIDGLVGGEGGDEDISGSVKGKTGDVDEVKPKAVLEPGAGPVEGIKGNDEGEEAGESGENTETDGEEEVKEYMVNERIIELGLGFPLLAEEMTYYDKLFGAARFSSATKRGMWGACEVKPDEKNLYNTQELTECVIKGAKLISGKKVYRTPECKGYKETLILTSESEKWFCSVEEAEGAGFEKAEDCG